MTQQQLHLVFIIHRLHAVGIVLGMIDAATNREASRLTLSEFVSAFSAFVFTVTKRAHIQKETRDASAQFGEVIASGECKGCVRRSSKKERCQKIKSSYTFVLTI
jgi:hypothetical protein